jgi:hypothetical protein
MSAYINLHVYVNICNYVNIYECVYKLKYIWTLHAHWILNTHTCIHDQRQWRSMETLLNGGLGYTVQVLPKDATTWQSGVVTDVDGSYVSWLYISIFLYNIMSSFFKSIFNMCMYITWLIIQCDLDIYIYNIMYDNIYYSICSCIHAYDWSGDSDIWWWRRVCCRHKQGFFQYQVHISSKGT